MAYCTRFIPFSVIILVACGSNPSSDLNPSPSSPPSTEDDGTERDLARLLPAPKGGGGDVESLADGGAEPLEPTAGAGGSGAPEGGSGDGSAGSAPEAGVAGQGPVEPPVASWSFPEVLVGEWLFRATTILDCSGGVVPPVEDPAPAVVVHIDEDYSVRFDGNTEPWLLPGSFGVDRWHPEPVDPLKVNAEIWVEDADTLSGTYEKLGCAEGLSGWEFNRTLAP